MALFGFGISTAGHLEIAGCDAADLAREFGTPLHVLDEDRLRANCRAYTGIMAQSYGTGRVLFASKACCIVATCQIAHQEGLGVDVASGGEIYTARRAGVPASEMYFHGNNKTPHEIEDALRIGVGRFIVDNDYELDLLEALTGRLGVQAHIQLRLTPGIEPHTHQAIRTGGVDSKFGFGILDGAAYRAVERARKMPGVHLRGLHAHIGSQIFDLEPFRQSAAALLDFAARIRDEFDVTVEELNLGGGLAIRYLRTDETPSIRDYIGSLTQTVNAKLGEHRLSPPTLFVEPGRSIVGDAGVTLYTVGAVKVIPGVRTYVSVDGGM
ncbi:MAG: diaminopimelate decarboxylase, partial [Armatimonadetes bacterium]|nr:diaminopimelate decarboxylase [Armatimonadota bacterium]